MNRYKHHKIKKVIEATWNNPEGKELRHQLFPDGIPEPEELVRTIAEYIINQKQTSEPSE